MRGNEVNPKSTISFDLHDITEEIKISGNLKQLNVNEVKHKNLGSDSS